jgi:hypothetical protein
VAKYDAFGREIGEDTLAGLGGSPSQPTGPSWQERNDRDEATWQAAEKVEVARLQTAADAADAQAERAEDARQDAAGDARWTAPGGQPPKPTFVRPAADDPERRALAAQLGGVLNQAAAARATGTRPTVTGQRRGAGRGWLIATVVVLAVLGLLIASVVGLVSSVDVKTGGTSGGTITAAPEPAKPAPQGLAAGSLVRRDNLAAALREIRSSGGGRLTHLRVAPERIDATLLTPAGRLRNVQMRPGGQLERLGPDSGPGFDQTSTIPFSRLNPAAPQRLARAGAERIHVPVSTLQYAVPTVFSGTLNWAAYFKRGRYVLGNASGRFQRAYP